MEKKKFFLIATGLFCTLIIILMAPFLALTMIDAKTEANARSANGITAITFLKNVGGESQILNLANLNEAAAVEKPEEYLAENSKYELDYVAIENYVIESIESKATEEKTAAELVQEWGYESFDSYKEILKTIVEEFIKQRLAVYKVAEQYGITIEESEYEKQLKSYSTKYGYADTDVFEQECMPQSIADEMLFDKTISYIVDVLQE